MSDEAFLSRWSRLKRTATKPEPEPVVAEEIAADPPADMALPVAVEPGAEPTVEPEDPLKDLPSIADLTGESDFTPFLRAEVPEDLHRQALRKLWTSDPIYANDDGLKDYADDYTGLFNLTDPVKTLYRVGKGFLDDADVADATDPVEELPPEPIPSLPRGEGQGEGDSAGRTPLAAQPPPPDGKRDGAADKT